MTSSKDKETSGSEASPSSPPPSKASCTEKPPLTLALAAPLLAAKSRCYVAFEERRVTCKMAACSTSESPPKAVSKSNLR